MLDCVVGFGYEVGGVGFRGEGAGEGAGGDEHGAGIFGEADEEVVDVVEVGVEQCWGGGGEGGVGAVWEVQVGVVAVAHFEGVVKMALCGLVGVVAGA